MEIKLSEIKQHVTNRSDKFGVFSPSDVTCGATLAMINALESSEASADSLASQLATAQDQLKDAITQRHYWFEAFNRQAKEHAAQLEQVKAELERVAADRRACWAQLDAFSHGDDE